MLSTGGPQGDGWRRGGSKAQGGAAHPRCHPWHRHSSRERQEAHQLLDIHRAAGQHGHVWSGMSCRHSPLAEDGSRDTNKAPRMTGRDGSGAGGTKEREAWAPLTSGLHLVSSQLGVERASSSELQLGIAVNVVAPSVNSEQPTAEAPQARSPGASASVGTTGAGQKRR